MVCVSLILQHCLDCNVLFCSQSDKDHCLLLALPCGRDPLDVHTQTRALKSGFINYLQQKQAAGIINVARPGSTQVMTMSNYNRVSVEARTLQTRFKSCECLRIKTERKICSVTLQFKVADLNFEFI